MTLEIVNSKRDKSIQKNQDPDLHRILKLIKNNRCRSLTDDDVKEIYDDIEEEVILSTSVYELSEELRDKTIGRFEHDGR